MFISNYFPILVLLMTLAIVSVRTNKLTLAGAVTGGAIALMIYAGAGYKGLAMLAAFFILGTAATVWKKNEKQQIKINEDQSVKRNAGQVLANGGMAGIMGSLSYCLPAGKELLGVMMAASLASAMADTLSSELGMVYGRQFYNIITLKKDEKGLDGVVSLEGLLIGIIGSAIIALIYAVGFGWDKSFLLIIIAGTTGNLADSVLGALWERKHQINNDTVNFLNTLIAAVFAGAFWLLQ